MIIRPFLLSDLSDLEKVALSFPSFQRQALKFEGLIYVAEDNGTVIGAIKGRLIESALGKLGSIQWLMIHPDHQSFRSRSITTPLMEELLGRFDQEGTRWQVACADLANLPSSRGVEHFGFQPAGFTWTWKTFGWRWPSVAYKIWHLVDIGQILWVKEENHVENHSWRETILLLLSFTLPWWFLSGTNPMVLCLALCFLALRDLPQLTTKDVRLTGARFNCFDSSFLPCLLLSLTGQWFPYFGVWTHRHRDNSRKRVELAKVQMMGLLLSLLSLGLLSLYGPIFLLEASRKLLLCLPIYLFAELILPTFPFKGSIRNRFKRK